MNIDGNYLTTYQSCQRRWLLDQRWRVLRWRGKSLFDSCLRQAIFAISNGADPAAEIQRVRTRLMATAANPGLDMAQGGDPWIVANDYCGMLATVLTALSRLVLLTIRRPEPITLSTNVSWQPLSFADESGTLHRWITCDTFDDDLLAREVHSWRIFGDMAVLDAPLTLHIIEIGQNRNGRRQSPWARAWKHPIIAGRFKFQRNDGKGGHRALSGSEWKPLWYVDQTRPDPAAWVDLMDAEGVTPRLLHHIPIAQPSEGVRRNTLDQITQIAAQMSHTVEVAEAMELPMSRGACDGLVPCPFQNACYREHPAEGIGEIGLYQLRSSLPSSFGIPSPGLVSADHLDHALA